MAKDINGRADELPVRVRPAPSRSHPQGNQARTWVIDPTRLPPRGEDNFLLVPHAAVLLPVTNDKAGADL